MWDPSIEPYSPRVPFKGELPKSPGLLTRIVDDAIDVIGTLV